MKLAVGLLALLSPLAADAKSVFAHFMVGNTAKFDASDWGSNIDLAKAAGIDAFALNMANGENTTDTSVPLAFSAAESKGFKLFFSFDYAGNGPWDAEDVEALIAKYAASSAYYYRGSQPLVSTFEGPDNAADWVEIKKSTGCFFIPDWSSLGAKDAVGLANGVADGLFSWAAWTSGPADGNTYTDASYHEFLGGKPYMMPISPWFYTNLPGYNKNWLWRGDSLWFDRWQQLIALDNQPEFVEIISWNDFGESHYIGPLDDRQYDAFTVGKAPFNYVQSMPHDGWRDILPFAIATWKSGKATLSKETLIGWYRINPAGACADGGTTGNTASQLQLEYPPAQIIQDKIFFSAILASNADVSVSIGGASVAASWYSKPYGGIGMYGGSASTNGATGTVTITVTRNGAAVLTLSGAAISSACSSGYNNYNAWVGSKSGGGITPATPSVGVSALNCTGGFGVFNFAGLCNFTCGIGYCPSSACTCTNLGKADPPPETGAPGYPLAGESPSYEGLCSFACNHNYCPTIACGPTKQPETIPTTPEFAPAVPISGTGPDPFSGLCSYACNYGFCPIHRCTVSKTGTLNVPPGLNASIIGSVEEGYTDSGICNFACQRDYCPFPCTSKVVLTPSDPDPTGPAVVPDPTCVTTLSQSAYPAAPTDTSGETPVEGYSFFSIQSSCYSDTTVVDDKKYANKGKFYEQAYKDAMELADQALDWPQYGTDASNLYFGKNTESDEYGYKDSIHTNLEVISKWENPQWGFDNYIVLGCAQDSHGNDAGMGNCKSKIGQDPRNIICYVNNTRSWWWNKSYVWCCNPFFSINDVEAVAYENRNDDINNMDLRYYQTSGSALVHELLHTLEITGVNGERKHIVDAKFENGRRIYGPVDVAKGARAYGPFTTTENADSYAQFVSAHYWQKRTGGKVPQPSVSAAAPAGAVFLDGIGDSSANYYDSCVSAPDDFNCDCNEDGCSVDSAPCCASGSCACNCNEDSCPPPNPACCASGSCKF